MNSCLKFPRLDFFFVWVGRFLGGLIFLLLIVGLCVVWIFGIGFQIGLCREVLLLWVVVRSLVLELRLQLLFLLLLFGCCFFLLGFLLFVRFLCRLYWWIVRLFLVCRRLLGLRILLGLSFGRQSLRLLFLRLMEVLLVFFFQFAFVFRFWILRGLLLVCRWWSLLLFWCFLFRRLVLLLIFLCWIRWLFYFLQYLEL